MPKQRASKRRRVRELARETRKAERTAAAEFLAAWQAAPFFPYGSAEEIACVRGGLLLCGVGHDEAERLAVARAALCPDCGVRPGKRHRPFCDQEQCPLCFGQRLSCCCPG